MVRAFGIFSGGLDSLLSARLLMEQGLKPDLVTLASPFFALDQARAGAEALGLELTVVDIYDELLALVKNPPNGLGKNLNPCIDCHSLMLKEAGRLLEASGEPGFLFSGEVVGQRPMSQNPRALKIVSRNSGREDLVLRPLSARLLPATRAENEGWVNRDKLLGLSGRGRRAQIDLAEQFGLPVPPPAGGCLLTDAGYCRRFKWLLERPQGKNDQAWPPARLAEMIKRGRLFSPGGGQFIVVGRNQADNKALSELAGPGDILCHLEGAVGPTVIVPRESGLDGSSGLDLAENLAVAYGDHQGEGPAQVGRELVGQGREILEVPASKPPRWEEFMVKGV